MAERQAQSARDRAAHRRSMQFTANLRSIPKGPPQKKGAQFTRGALKTPQFAPRGHGYYDAFAQTPDSAVVSATTGPATVISGYSSDTVPGGPNVTGTYTLGTGLTSPPYTGNATLIMFNPGSSDDVIGKIHRLGVNAAGTLNVATTNIVASQFGELGPARGNDRLMMNVHVDGDPNTTDVRPTRRVESIPLRGSLRIRNVTEALSVGGAVRALRYNGGIQMNADTPSSGQDNIGAPADPGMFLTVCSMVRDSPRTKIFDGHELRHSHQSNTYPADFVRSMAFECDTTFDEAVARPGYCNLIILIDDFTASNTLTNNSYEVTMMVQRAARFGMGTILGGMARSLRVVKTDDHTALDEARAPLYLTQ